MSRFAIVYEDPSYLLDDLDAVDPELIEPVEADQHTSTTGTDLSADCDTDRPLYIWLR